MSRFFLSACVGLLSVLPTPVSAAPDSQGKEFILGFMENKVWKDTQSNEVELFITTVSTDTVTVTVTTPLYDPGWNSTVTVSKGNLKTVTIPLGIRGNNTEKSNKGVHVIATEEISVYCVNKEKKSTDAYISLPVDVLGKDYYAVTYIKDPELLVVGTEANTVVNVTWPTHAGRTEVVYGGVTYRDGETLSLVLNRFEMFHVLQRKKRADFTGARITSDKPVSVISGNRKVSVPLGASSDDHLTEMLMPVNTWGKTFITTSTPDRSIGDLFRIVASEENTNVTLGNGTSFSIEEAGDFVELDVATGDYQVVTADKPVMMVMLAKTNEDRTGRRYGDPGMTIIISEPQYASDYTWSSVGDPTGQEFSNKVSVIIDRSKVDGLLLDDEPVTWEENVDVPGSGGKAHLWARVSAGSHNLYHTDPTVTFMTLVSGAFRGTSYAYLAGLRLANINAECISGTHPVPGDIIDNDCDGRVDEEAFNGVDDDGDGKIDEDLAALPRGAHWCELTGDPHLSDFNGDRAYVAMPCLYRVARLTVTNLVHKPGVTDFPFIEVDVLASNAKKPIRGQYFVSYISVTVTFLFSNRSREGGPSGTFTTAYDHIHGLIQASSPLVGDTVWNSTYNGDLQGRVQLSYDVDNNLAELTIEGATPRVQFRFADPAGGIGQRLLPGVFIEVGVEQVADDSAAFPNTLCSKPDEDLSLEEHATAAGLHQSHAGVYAVLEQRLPQQMGAQPDQCSDAMTVYAACSNRTAAITQCSPLIHGLNLACCLETQVPVGAFGAFRQCLKFACLADAGACSSLKSYADACPDVSTHIQLTC